MFGQPCMDLPGPHSHQKTLRLGKAREKHQHALCQRKSSLFTPGSEGTQGEALHNGAALQKALPPEI